MSEPRPSRVLIDLLRCPEREAAVRAGEMLSREAGFFRFGQDVIGWGRTSAGTRARAAGGALDDLLSAARVEAGAVVLPFDLDEVIDNLRWERYAASPQGDNGSFLKRLVRQGYYLVRPLMGVAVRKYLQRAYLRSWDKIPFPRWPLDTTVETLVCRVLALSMRARGVDRLPFIWFWPDGRRAAVAMTHDVETAVGRDFSARLMDVDEQYGLRSAFHVIPEERYEVPDAYLASLRGRGFEINVHGLNHDGRLFTDYDLFKARAVKINEYVKKFGARGFRSPVLYRNLDWLHHLAVEYDMTVPNVAHLDPQRGGCCTVFPYFVGDILELPLTASQDYSLFNIMKDYSMGLWKEQVDRIVAANGLACFNIHPDYLTAGREMAAYQQLLAHLAARREPDGLWFALPGEINDWWRRRARMRLVPEGPFDPPRRTQGWRIEGQGSERAVLAFALLDGDRAALRMAGGIAAPAV